MGKISIIIPVYNVEPYLSRCLDSVLNQTYTNFEILCVDDGSTDNSGNICDEYAERDSRIKVFHKENGGLSTALNVGIKNFSGDYIGFADSDDWVEPQMYEVLYKSLTDINVHLSAVCFVRDYDTNPVVEAGIEKIPDRVLKQKEMLLYAIRNVHYAGFGRVVWNKLYRADIIKNSGVMFDDSLRIAMDLKFVTDLLMSGDITGIFTNKPLYHYVQRQGSLMRLNKMEYRLDELRCYKAIIEKADQKGFNDVTTWLKRQHCYNASLLTESAAKDNDNELLTFLYDEMRVYIKEYIETNEGYPGRIKRINDLLSMQRESLRCSGDS